MSVRILTGDCLATMATLPAGSVQCCVTSPPYYGLRDYGHAGQIGLEETPDAYVARLVDVFREVRRVLRDDGVLWLNLGDSYSTHAAGKVANPMAKSTLAGIRTATHSNRTASERTDSEKRGGIPEKNLLGIPWMVAFALRADGWWLRSDIIWHKPNPMPESITDRPTSAHEHVFLLTKRASYYYDAAAVAEDAIHAGRVVEYDEGQKNVAAAQDPRMRTRIAKTTEVGATRNLRNVWTIATQPYSGAHFATMPPELAERCIKAGSSERGQCPHCGAPWVRQTAKGEIDREWQRRSGGDVNGEYHGTSTKGHAAAGVQDASAVKARILAGMAPTITTGWAPSCDCTEHRPVPQTVLDPFGGAGTTGLVADRLNRSAILCELNPEYAALARDRIEGDAPMFAQVEA